MRRNDKVPEINDNKKNSDFSKENTTEGVQLLLGDPKKAVRKLSVPLIISMIVMSLYNLADAMWVAGLGADALAGVGFVTPIFLILIGLGNGLGAGTTAALSKYIGSKRKKDANNGAVHTIIITIVLTLIVTIILLSLLDPILIGLGAGKTLGYAKTYGGIIFTGSIFMLLPNAMYGILRAEGDVTRTMYAMVISAVLNIVLDPIFIYIFNMGVAGAAYATLLSSAFVLILLCYWFFIKKNTFIKPFKVNYKFNKQIAKDILNVGLPASAEFVIMAIFAGLYTMLLTSVANTNAVAVYSTGWRVVMLGTTPIIGIATAIVSVVGGNLGARKYENIRIAHHYGVKLGILIAIVTSLFIYVFAPQIVMLFSYSSTSAVIAPDMIMFLRVMIFFFLFMPVGAVSTFVFQGVGKGLTAMVQTLLRELVFAIVFAYIFAVTLGMGQYGAWWGLVTGNCLAAIITFIWSDIYVKHLIKIKGKSLLDD